MTDVLEVFGHGGDLVTAAERFGVEAGRFVDFSANINPLGPPARVLEGLREALPQVVHYPDPGHRSFRSALAAKLNLPASWLLPTNGAAEAMALAILALEPKTVGIVTPCFSEYAQLSKQFGARVLACPGREERGFKPDEAELYRLFERADLVFVGSPNNPTGLLYEPDELLRMAGWTAETDTHLVVDEAFLDFVAEERQFTLAGRLSRFPRVLVMRSLTKMFAIPGLRLGYAVAVPALIERLREKQVSWSVNSLALAAGELCLEESAYAAKTRRLIAEERSYLSGVIGEELGWRVWPGEANFLLVRCPAGLTAAELQEMLGRRGILIRSCAMYPGLTPGDFRIAVRTRQENDRLLAALRDVWSERRERR